MFKFISSLASIKLLLTIMFSSFRSLCTISTKKINNKSNEMDNEKIERTQIEQINVLDQLTSTVEKFEEGQV